MTEETFQADFKHKHKGRKITFATRQHDGKYIQSLLDDSMCLIVSRKSWARQLEPMSSRINLERNFHFPPNCKQSDRALRLLVGIPSVTICAQFSASCVFVRTWALGMWHGLRASPLELCHISMQVCVIIRASGCLLQAARPISWGRRVRAKWLSCWQWPLSPACSSWPACQPRPKTQTALLVSNTRWIPNAFSCYFPSIYFKVKKCIYACQNC